MSWDEGSFNWTFEADNDISSNVIFYGITRFIGNQHQILTFLYVTKVFPDFNEAINNRKAGISNKPRECEGDQRHNTEKYNFCVQGPG